MRPDYFLGQPLLAGAAGMTGSWPVWGLSPSTDTVCCVAPTYKRNTLAPACSTRYGPV